MTESLLTVEDLHTTFSTKSKVTRAVRGVSFDLVPGETIGIVGESGCGKSVMAKSLTRLLPSPSSQIEKGKILYKGEDLLKKNEKEMRKVRGQEISMIFQDPMASLNPTIKIGKQIAEAYKLHHRSASFDEVYERVIELLHQVGIPQPEARYNQFPHELSGGMRQRVMIAIAMIAKPHILVADEPTTALDPTIQAQILELLKEIQKKENMSIILITHDFSIVAGFCDRVLVMYAGEIIETATVDQLFNAPKHPYTRRLIQSIPRLDQSQTSTLYSVHGAPPDLSMKLPGCSFEKRCPHALEKCKTEKPKLCAIEPGHCVGCWLYDREARSNAN